jgi:hypothetical protein
MFETSRFKITVAGLLIAGCSMVLAQPTGDFIVVQNEVTRGTDTLVEPGQALAPGERYRTSGGAAAKLMLDGHTLISVGADSEFRVNGDDVRTEIDLTRGQLRVYSSPFAQTEPRVEIRTRALIAEALDSEVLVRVLDDGSSTAIVFSGAAVVSNPDRPGSSVDLAAAQQVHVSASGQIDDPTSVSPDVLEALWASVEAVPVAPRALPTRWLRQWAAPTRSGGERIATDCISCPDRRMVDGHDVDPGPGAAPVTGGSKAGDARDR